MNDFFTQFKNKARDLKLSHDEKQVMRVQLHNYFEQNPLAPFNAPATQPAARVPSMYVWFTPRFALPVVAVLIVGLSSGTAFAAKGALPGDPLYAIKINVNEKVQTALATTPEAKAQVNATLATARLEEAETLASTGKLTASATAELASNFAAHADAAQTSATDLEDKDPGTAAQLNAEFDSTLSAHGAILAEIGDNSSDSQTVENSNTFAMQISGHQSGRNNTLLALATDTSNSDSGNSGDSSDNAGGARVATFAAASATIAPQAQPMALSANAPAAQQTSQTKTKAAKTAPVENNPSGTEQDAKVASALGMQASTSLSKAAKDFVALTLDSDTSAKISDQLLTLQALYAQAAASMEAKDYLAAKTQFTSVLRMSVKLDTYLKAGKKFNIKLLTELLTKTDRSGAIASHQVAGAEIKMEKRPTPLL